MIIKTHAFHKNRHLIRYGCEKSRFYIDFYRFLLIFIDFPLIFIDFHTFPMEIISKSTQRPQDPGGRLDRGVGWPKFSSEWCSRPTSHLNFQVWAREKNFHFSPWEAEGGPLPEVEGGVHFRKWRGGLLPQVTWAWVGPRKFHVDVFSKNEWYIWI